MFKKYCHISIHELPQFRSRNATFPLTKYHFSAHEMLNIHLNIKIFAKKFGL